MTRARTVSAEYDRNTTHSVQFDWSFEWSVTRCAGGRGIKRGRFAVRPNPRRSPAQRSNPYDERACENPADRQRRYSRVHRCDFDRRRFDPWRFVSTSETRKSDVFLFLKERHGSPGRGPTITFWRKRRQFNVYVANYTVIRTHTNTQTHTTTILIHNRCRVLLWL